MQSAPTELGIFLKVLDMQALIEIPSIDLADFGNLVFLSFVGPSINLDQLPLSNAIANSLKS